MLGRSGHHFVSSVNMYHERSLKRMSRRDCSIQVVVDETPSLHHDVFKTWSACSFHAFCSCLNAISSFHLQDRLKCVYTWQNIISRYWHLTTCLALVYGFLPSSVRVLHQSMLIDIIRYARLPRKTFECKLDEHVTNVGNLLTVLRPAEI
jgi:hypothetical protein